jgi:diguanylate cyclase (GGDEF)-like protein
MLLSDRLAQEISRARRDRYRVAVLFVDLDRFEQLNETFGHVIADRVLQSVGHRLLSCARSSDIVGLQGGDKFAILVPGVRYVQDATVIAERTLRALRVPHRLGRHEMQLTASIGIVAYPDDGTEVETLFKNADLALHNAKDRGCDNYQYFMEHMNLRAPEWQSLEGAVRLAREKQAFLLHDQPTLDPQTATVVNVEALIRTRRSETQLVPTQQCTRLRDSVSTLAAP